jgi:hypothetical protein
MPRKSTVRNRPGHQAYTLIEFLAFTFMVAITAIVGKSVAARYGTWVGVGAGFIAALSSVCLVVLFYRWSWQRDIRRLKELTEKYRGIYRVIRLPSSDTSIIKPQGAEIKIGDYGWEAGPDREDGLIYLQGLAPDWSVVWHTGFRPDQVERVADKPSSQYEYWVPYWAKSPPPPPCPFSVVERETMTWGRPHHSHRYFQIPVLYRVKPKKRADNPGGTDQGRG